MVGSPHDAGFIDDPQLAAVNLMDAAKRNGATLRLHTQVEEIVKQDERVSGVKLKDGTTIDAPIVVNAAGPWSSALNRIADVESEMAITTSPMRQEVHAAEAPEDFNFDSGAPLLTDLDLGYYAVPKMGGTFYVGGVEPAATSVRTGTMSVSPLLTAVIVCKSPPSSVKELAKAEARPSV